MKCKNCYSHAINHHCHGRDGSDPDLCDVCYWRTRSEELRRLRAVFPAILETLGSGWCSPDCSVEFIEMIPAEVGAVIAKRDALIAALINSLEKINELASDSTDSDVWTAMESIGEISHNAITK